MDIRDYALLAEKTYSDKPTFGKLDGSARAMVYGNVVAFRGSDNIATWLADLNVDVVKIPGMGFIHEGFWDAFTTIDEPLMQHKGVEVVTGHSLGGALAILYAAMLCLDNRPPKAIYAFEPPRVSSDPTLKTLFLKNGVNVVLTRNGEDVVPMIPRIMRDWQHPGPLMTFGKPAFPFPNVEDHLIGNVVAAIPTK